MRGVINMDGFLNLINTSLISNIISAILGSFLTLIYVEHMKKKYEKKLLLSILHQELFKYSEPALTVIDDSFQFRMREQLTWNILTSGLLDLKKDCELITHLYELIGWIENFNYSNDYANQCLVAENKAMLKFFSNGRDRLYQDGYRERIILLELLKIKYKIS